MNALRTTEVNDIFFSDWIYTFVSIYLENAKQNARRTKPTRFPRPTSTENSSTRRTMSPTSSRPSSSDDREFNTRHTPKPDTRVSRPHEQQSITVVRYSLSSRPYVTTRNTFEHTGHVRLFSFSTRFFTSCKAHSVRFARSFPPRARSFVFLNLQPASNARFSRTPAAPEIARPFPSRLKRARLYPFSNGRRSDTLTADVVTLTRNSNYLKTSLNIFVRYNMKISETMSVFRKQFSW